MANLAYQVTGFAYQGIGLFAYQGSADSTSTTDTHDGYKREIRVPGFDEERYETAGERERLRRTIEAALDPDSAEPVTPALVAAVEPYATVLPTQTVMIDWRRIEDDAVAMLTLKRYAAEQERLRLEFEEDERDVETLLLH